MYVRVYIVCSWSNSSIYKGSQTKALAPTRLAWKFIYGTHFRNELQNYGAHNYLYIMLINEYK